LPEIVRESAGERQFIQRVNPVRPLVVELPIAVRVRLLLAVAGALTEPTAGVQPRSQECALVPLFGSLAVGTCSAQLGENLPHCGKDEGMVHSEIDAPGRNPTILTTRMKRSFHGFARDLSGKRATKVVPSSSDDCTSIVPPCAVTISFAI